MRITSMTINTLAPLILACCAMGQRVEVTNHTDQPLVGWFQCNIDSMPLHASGFISGKCNFVVGHKSGRDTWNLDVYTVVQPHEHLVLDLAQAEFGGFQLPPPPENDYLGGVAVKVGGVRMTQEAAEINGAGYDYRFVARVGPMLVVHLFLHWYPDQKGWCPGEVVITASNPAVQDVVAVIPPDFRLQVGDATISIPGLPPDAPLMAEGDWLADAQRRALPLTLTWPHHFGEYDAQTAQARVNVQAGIRGVRKLHIADDPPLPPGFDGAAWASGVLPEVISKLHDWSSSRLDPNANSGDTGAQGSQAPNIAAPATAHPLAAMPLYLTTLAASWPMFHLEQDGSMLNWRGHPDLRLFGGRVNRRICDDTLGKDSEPTSWDRHAHLGPDWEHWFHFNGFAGARLMGTPATQMFLEGHAAQFLFTFPVDPPGNWLPPNRGVGWMCYLAVELYENLKDRELAEAVATRWRALFHQSIKTTMSGDEFWSWRTDPRIGWTPGTPERAMPWQAAVYVAGLDRAAFVFGVEEAWLLAANSAHDFVMRTYVNQGGQWLARDVICRDGSDPGPQYIGFYGHFGNPLGVSTILHHNAGHAIAVQIWPQLMATTDLRDLSWLVPWRQP